MGGEVHKTVARNDMDNRIVQAATDWCLDELDGNDAIVKLRGSLHSAFVDGAYWAIQQAAADRLKVKVKGES